MENWKTVSDFPKYEVSDEGRVRNLKTGRVLKNTVNQRGYAQVFLSDKNGQTPKRVHRIVAETFIEGDNKELDVNHKDGNKLNNRLDNLEFCTRSENVKHAFITGLKTPSRQVKIKIVETGEVYDSIRECARKINRNQAAICKCLKGEQCTCAGYHFERV